MMSIERELLKRVLNYVENKYLTVDEFEMTTQIDETFIEVKYLLGQPEPTMTQREMYQRGYAAAERYLKREPLSDEEKHRARANVIMAKMINKYADDSTEVLTILSKALCKMAEGDLDISAADNFHTILDNAINAPFNKRHNPFNRFVTDALYAEALEIADLNFEGVSK